MVWARFRKQPREHAGPAPQRQAGIWQHALRLAMRGLRACLGSLPSKVRRVVERTTGIDVPHDLSAGAVAASLHVTARQLANLEKLGLQRLLIAARNHTCGAGTQPSSARPSSGRYLRAVHRRTRRYCRRGPRGPLREAAPTRACRVRVTRRPRAARDQRPGSGGRGPAHDCARARRRPGGGSAHRPRAMVAAGQRALAMDPSSPLELARMSWAPAPSTGRHAAALTAATAGVRLRAGGHCCGPSDGGTGIRNWLPALQGAIS